MKHKTYSDLEDLPGDCEALFDAAGKSSFFHTFPWYCNLVKHGLPKETNLHVYVAEGD